MSVGASMKLMEDLESKTLQNDRPRFIAALHIFATLPEDKLVR